MTYQPAVPLSAASVDNASTTPLSGGATYTGTGELNLYPEAMVSCQTDAEGRLYFDFSTDGTNWTVFPVNGFRVEAGIHEFHTAIKGPRYFRVRLVNGSSAQSYLRLATYFGTFARSPSAPLNQSVANDADSIIVRAVSDETDSMIGLYSGRFIVSKFGRNGAINTGTVPEDVWNGAGVYTGFPTGSAETIDVFSADANDTAAGTGARTVRLFGLDANYRQQTEDVTLNGTTPVTTVNTWSRMNRAVVLTAGSGGKNAGEITARHTTTTANVFMRMPASAFNYSQTEIAAYTIPEGHTGYLRRYSASMDDNTANSAQMAIWVRESGAAERMVRPFVVATDVDYNRELYGAGLELPERTDIAMRVASVANSGAIITAQFALLVVRDLLV